MIQIALHPPFDGTPQQEVRLPLPWCWWEARFYPNESGVLYEQRILPEGFERADQIEEQSVTFGREGDEVILTDPPAMHVTVIEPSYRGIDDLAWRSSSLYMIVRVVWHEPPHRIQAISGLQVVEGWRALRNRTCTPRRYRFASVERDDWPEAPRGLRYPTYPPRPPLPVLEWPITPTIRNGEPSPPYGPGITPPAPVSEWWKYIAMSDIEVPGFPRAYLDNWVSSTGPKRTAGRRLADPAGQRRRFRDRLHRGSE